MRPITFAEQNTTYAKDQPQYLPLPAHKDEMGVVTTCWALSWRDRIKLLFTGRLWLQQMTFDEPLQPQLPHLENPL